MSAKRQSILSRPIRAVARANEESADATHERDQALLEAKQRKFHETAEFLRRSRFGDATHLEKIDAAERLRQSQCQHMEYRRRAEELERLQDKAAAGMRSAVDAAAAQSEAERNAQRAAAEREAMAVNRRLADDRRERERREKAQAQQRERADLLLADQLPRYYR